MKNDWKKFTITISVLLIVIIACTTVNVTLNKLTEKVFVSNDGYNNNNYVSYDQNGNVVADNGQDGGSVVNGGTNVNGQQNTATNNASGTNVNSNTNTNTNSGSKVNANTNANTNNGGQVTQQQSSANPTSYSKAELVNYYNNCLKKTYSQRAFTVTKTEVVDVQIKSLLLNGSQSNFLQNAANSILESNKKKAANNSGTKSFSGGNVADNERYILPTNLYANAVRSASASKSGSGYVVNFTLNAESCNFTTKPPYNSSCTFPLDINEVDLGNLGQITSANFYYPGTTLQATIDGNGRVVKTYVVMPLNVTNAEGTGAGQTVTAEISGQWLCTNIFSF